MPNERRMMNSAVFTQDAVLLVSKKKKRILKQSRTFALNFPLNLKKSPETIVLLKKAFGDACLSNSSNKKWHKEFKDGRKSVHDAP